ncbi:SRSF protein kinase 1-like [Condylostylus longicornis]|uniref:SRSF protein kinase 1-like n=1 Tax=Condylostylus longicornis TaxID=2530218 RepID=UPI00244DC0E8|nr:SRSF protein kinase 1-like [Condylostylus longicornis]
MTQQKSSGNHHSKIENIILLVKVKRNSLVVSTLAPVLPISGSGQPTQIPTCIQEVALSIFTQHHHQQDTNDSIKSTNYDYHSNQERIELLKKKYELYFNEEFPCEPPTPQQQQQQTLPPLSSSTTTASDIKTTTTTIQLPSHNNFILSSSSSSDDCLNNITTIQSSNNIKNYLSSCSAPIITTISSSTSLPSTTTGIKTITGKKSTTTTAIDNIELPIIEKTTPTTKIDKYFSFNNDDNDKLLLLDLDDEKRPQINKNHYKNNQHEINASSILHNHNKFFHSSNIININSSTSNLINSIPLKTSIIKSTTINNYNNDDNNDDENDDDNDDGNNDDNDYDDNIAIRKIWSLSFQDDTTAIKDHHHRSIDFLPSQEKFQISSTSSIQNEERLIKNYQQVQQQPHHHHHHYFHQNFFQNQQQLLQHHHHHHHHHLQQLQLLQQHNNQQQHEDDEKAQPVFLSLSLSPPTNRRKEMPALKGSFISLSEPRSILKTKFLDDTFPNPDSGESGLSDEEQEDPAQYCKGGYHPITIGDVFDDRFRVVRKLGWGHFSTVWLCRDTLDEKYVALKVVKSAPHYSETAADEIRLLKAIRDADPNDPKRERIIRLFTHFTVRGVNGYHHCLVFEALGCSLYKLIVKNNYQGLALHQVRVIIKQVLEGLDYLHTKCSIIHTDIKPENILLVMDNAADMNRRIDDEMNTLRLQGIDYPDSYISSIEKQTKGSQSLFSRSPSSANAYSSVSRAEILDESTDQNGFMASAANALYNDLINDDQITGSLDEDISINRYRTERKNTGKVNGNREPQANYIPQTQAYINAIQTLIKSRNIKVKIADLGNACYDFHHFTEDIQTRQYRSIEVILGAQYYCSADIWSTACLAFEIATGDYLFDPHAGETYSRDEDHLAHMIELLGSIPVSLILKGKHGLKYFTSCGKLRNITKLKPWNLLNVLTEKYDWDKDEAKKITDFLLPMLNFNPLIRSSADECLRHQWLQDL